jgi:endonuclease YncB( thermonuclease family)
LKSQDLSGTATALDGDTIKLGEVRIRLHGIDAPEKKQTCSDAAGAEYGCGEAATQRLAKILKSAMVECITKDIDRYDRVVAECYSDGMNINALLVGEGLAVAYTKYSSDYIEIEVEAKEARLGLWGGNFIQPSRWRKGDRLDQGQNNPHNGCAIKGNISKNGKLYHLPGTRWYQDTGINEEKGERWFCNEEEAIAAGWVKARN